MSNPLIEDLNLKIITWTSSLIWTVVSIHYYCEEEQHKEWTKSLSWDIKRNNKNYTECNQGEIYSIKNETAGKAKTQIIKMIKN